MNYKLLSILLIFLGNLTEAQTKIPAIKASSKTVDIKDGKHFSKGGWTISPEIKPDVYITNIPNNKVTFYTDIDSITFIVLPNKTYNFKIILNNTDTALTQIKYEPSYLDILKNAAKYNNSENRTIPNFTYQTADNLNLMELRKGFNLDSIAGTGNEVSKIINLLHWVHNIIPHDGEHENPTVKNALSLISVCKKESRGLNCRGLATVLNECYLSIGIRSRFITCMPKDSVFNDCHVINMVYSSELKKWLWIDPTNDAYVMNEKGELLSIQEVRERVINGGTLIVNPDANWNRKSSVLKEEYLYNYMAKNLYRMECPLVSEYDFETWNNGKQVTYIDLLPLDAFNQSPIKTQETNSKTGTTFIRYKTNNPNSFWTKPQ